MTNRGPFDFVNSITYTKEYLMNTDLDEKEYSPFLTNRALSYHVDAIIDASLMNLFSDLDSKLQYDYYLNSLTKRKRFSKWAKNQSSDDINMIMQFYNYNRRKAEQALTILTDSQLVNIRTIFNEREL